MAFEDLAFKPPIHAIRVKTCGNDWTTDCDATLTADKVRGFALDSEGVKVYSRERDIHGDYDNIYVPYSNLEALVFYFNEPPKLKSNADRVRAMTDEELADWLGVYCNGQTAQEVGKPCVSGMGSCEECWLDWLREEVTDV